ncbi:MAG: cystathionine beta-lyase [Paludibacter sp. 47-17]|nr:MAG: putative C-S lyase [Paludibacter sp.]OJX90288.1 MAG: cystathionine beta-lyase [Paludibacter sp. 47-17]
MMNYNFDEIIDRKGTDAVKLERCKALFGTEDVLPLWVADMDFRTPDFILDTIRKRLDHPILGYSVPPEGFNDAFVKWVRDHHRWPVSASQVGFVPGIVPALSFAVQCFSEPGDEVMIQPPVYYPFFNVIRNNNRVVVTNPLREAGGKFAMDFDDLESKITEKTRLFILCNPHNPGGKVWTPETLRRLDEICTRRNILVVSDEVHADMVLNGYRHTPYATVSDTAAKGSVTFMAPTKVFNMPGIVSSSYIIPDGALRARFAHFLEAAEMNTGNLFAYLTTVACYEQGEEWRVAMLEYVQGNIRYVIDYLAGHLPQIRPMEPEASFLLWLDCSALGMDTDTLHRFFALKAGLGLNKGTVFGEGGEYHLRLNVACPRAVLVRAMQQLSAAVAEL